MKTSLKTPRLSADELDELHRVAHEAYLQGKYDEAVRYFWFISLHAPQDVRYLKGLGAALFMTRDFSKASVVYYHLLRIATKDPEVNCMLGHTLLMLGDRDSARKHLDYSLRLPGGDSSMTARARALLELVGP
jgi:Flp pilus assembly protein TadD